MHRLAEAGKPCVSIRAPQLLEGRLGRQKDSSGATLFQSAPLNCLRGDSFCMALISSEVSFNPRPSIA